jgi:transposase
MMGKRDFRKLDAATQAELRRVAVRMVQAGKTRREAADAVEVNPRFVGTWVTAVERSGEAALAGGRRGRRPDEQKALSPKQETRIKCLITGKCPDDLDLPFALWTREAVGMLIERETDMRLSRSTIGSYLRSWGFTPQRPRKRATERHEPAVQAWLDRDYPAIVKRAKAEDAEIHWGGETGVSNQANYGRSFAPKGQTPLIARPATRFSCSIISTLVIVHAYPKRLHGRMWRGDA